MGAFDESKKSTRPSHFEHGEVWGGDQEDDEKFGDTLALRVKRWYRTRSDTKCHAYKNTISSRITIRRASIGLTAILTFIIVRHLLCMARKFKISQSQTSVNSTCATDEFGYNSSFVPQAAFQPPEPSPFRAADSTDAFKNYLYRNHTDCQISSLDLHAPFAPLCTDSTSMLEAISGGGRIGFEAPFMPRGCDMRWFSTEEVCEIFSRFERVIVVGDSMMRHMVGAMNVLLRKDLGYGAVTNWNFSPKERRECFCNQQFDVKECSLQGIFKTADVLLHDPGSLACLSSSHHQQQAPIDLIIEMMLKFPLDPTEVTRFQALLSPTKPGRPYAFVFGHGLWNDLDLQATVNWLDGILESAKVAAPYLAFTYPTEKIDKNHNKPRSRPPPPLWPRLFVTPNAAGPLKPDQWITSQGDKALQMFEHSVREEVRERGVEHLGTWNMSIQSNKFDGVHLDLRGNLIKAMAVINWLSLIKVDTW